ncbi:hypothetical protein NLJ89_g6697 [Agrocybe chaxingu]|uniref:Uncharacterized protein n=1 Tax=Agrocybe chaxingu TaxID=84603 RepID=A0A9W8JYQ1_9AGAR|nr:hypothetical protein NLJ89_g6697 [Agrocybe chaxingu]
MKFFTAVLVALAAVVVASPTPEAPASFILTDAEFDNWLATTDAEITYVGSIPARRPSRPPVSLWFFASLAFAYQGGLGA